MKMSARRGAPRGNLIRGSRSTMTAGSLSHPECVTPVKTDTGSSGLNPGCARPQLAPAAGRSPGSCETTAHAIASRYWFSRVSDKPMFWRPGNLSMPNYSTTVQTAFCYCWGSVVTALNCLIIMSIGRYCLFNIVVFWHTTWIMLPVTLTCITNKSRHCQLNWNNFNIAIFTPFSLWCIDS